MAYRNCEYPGPGSGFLTRYQSEMKMTRKKKCLTIVNKVIFDSISCFSIHSKNVIERNEIEEMPKSPIKALTLSDASVCTPHNSIFHFYCCWFTVSRKTLNFNLLAHNYLTGRKPCAGAGELMNQIDYGKWVQKTNC